MGITHKLTAVPENKLPADDWNDEHDVSDLPASVITTGDLDTARMLANVIAAVNASEDADKIDNNQLDDIAWSKVLKAGSSLADLATRSAASLNSGDLAAARLSSNIVSALGSQEINIACYLQALLLNGSRPMSGALDMDGFEIENIGGDGYSTAPGIFWVYELSENVLHNNAPMKKTQSVPYIKLKETMVGVGNIAPTAILRIKFKMRYHLGFNTVYGRIYKNGVAVGTVRTTGSSTYVTFTEDIGGGWASGDLLQIYGHAQAGTEVQIIDLAVHGTLSPAYVGNSQDP